jgi:hypothetical protein
MSTVSKRESAPMVTIPMQVNAQDLWESTWGSGFETWSWWRRLDYVGDAAWDVIGKVKLGVTDPNDPSERKIKTKTIGLDDIVAAVAGLAAVQPTVWGTPVTDFESWDACVSDAVLQFAVFGEVIYG